MEKNKVYLNQTLSVQFMTCLIMQHCTSTRTMAVADLKIIMHSMLYLWDKNLFFSNMV